MQCIQGNRDLSKWPCRICHNDIASNSILCCQCNHWIHKRCTGIKSRIKANPDYCAGLSVWASKRRKLPDINCVMT